jgi:predicted nucleotide-binding protein (sugar kinase/HSP70/actin superfamily)
MARIGIPRALYWHDYGSLWKGFFENLGLEVVVSPETNSQIVGLGVENSDINLCFAVKLYIGHLLELKEKVDMMFIPSVMGRELLSLCSYHKALPDMVKNLFPDMKILTARLYIKNEKLLEKTKQGFLELGRKLGKTEDETINALKKAFEVWGLKKQGNDDFKKNLEKDKLKIAVIGAEYIVKDKFCIYDILKLLEKENAVPVFLKGKNHEVGFKVRWMLEQEFINQYFEALNNETIDGVIYISPFTCGPLFLIEEQVLNSKKKILNLKVDESLSETSLKTRIEAFMDLLRRNNR